MTSLYFNWFISQKTTPFILRIFCILDVSSCLWCFVVIFVAWVFSSVALAISLFCRVWVYKVFVPDTRCHTKNVSFSGEKLNPSKWEYTLPRMSTQSECLRSLADLALILVQQNLCHWCLSWFIPYRSARLGHKLPIWQSLGCGVPIQCPRSWLSEMSFATKCCPVFSKTWI